MRNLIVDINFTFAVLVQIHIAQLAFEFFVCILFQTSNSFFKGNTPFLHAYCDLAYAYSDLDPAYFPHK